MAECPARAKDLTTTAVTQASVSSSLSADRLKTSKLHAAHRLNVAIPGELASKLEVATRHHIIKTLELQRELSRQDHDE